MRHSSVLKVSTTKHTAHSARLDGERTFTYSFVYEPPAYAYLFPSGHSARRRRRLLRLVRASGQPETEGQAGSDRARARHRVEHELRGQGAWRHPRHGPARHPPGLPRVRDPPVRLRDVR